MEFNTASADQDNPRIATLGENKYLENTADTNATASPLKNSNNTNNSDENSCDENGEKSMYEHSTTNSSSLKRKRLCDIAYTAEATFDSHAEAAQYVDAMAVWKFERNRPTKKGSKGFYYCKLSENCKSKIYLLSDPFSKKVILFQNNIEHDHTGGPPSVDAIVSMTHSAPTTKKSRVSLSAASSRHDNGNRYSDILYFSPRLYMS